MFDKLKLHDTCGVHYLHGIPGVLSGLLSVLFCFLASEDVYGPRSVLVLSSEKTHFGLLNISICFHAPFEKSICFQR